MAYLTTYEMVVLMTDALQLAATAFAKLTGMDIHLQKPMLRKAGEMNLGAASDFYVLTTEVKGSLQGKSYLLLNNDEAMWVINRMKVQRSAPAESLTGLQKAALLELDNILSAAAITQIANQLDIFCYGDVPGLQKMNAAQLRSLLTDAERQYPFSVQASYHSTDNQLQTAFIWMLDGSCMQAASPSNA